MKLHQKIILDELQYWITAYPEHAKCLISFAEKLCLEFDLQVNYKFKEVKP